MDPVTHICFGAALARAGFNRKAAYATAAMAVAAELPDIDIVLQAFNPVSAFQHHRGATHTLLGAPVVAAAAVGLVYAWHRWQTRTDERQARWRARQQRHSAPLRWGTLYLFALLASLTHILLDFTNNYGVRPFMPLNYHWYAWDTVNIIEPLWTGVLALALVMPRFFAMIGSEIGERQRGPRGRGWAIFALLATALLWWGRDYEHRRALALLDHDSFETGEVLRRSCNPYAFTPFRWYCVAETQSAFHLVLVDTSKDAVDPENDARIRYKPEETAVTLAAKKSRLGRVYLDWARYPLVETETLQGPAGGYHVHFRDLRYAYPEMSGTVLGAYVDLDTQLRVQEEGFDHASESLLSRARRLVFPAKD